MGAKIDIRKPGILISTPRPGDLDCENMHLSPAHNRRQTHLGDSNGTALKKTCVFTYSTTGYIGLCRRATWTCRAKTREVYQENTYLIEPKGKSVFVSLGGGRRLEVPRVGRCFSTFSYTRIPPERWQHQPLPYRLQHHERQ
jgi:hypothetical protein